MTYNANIPQASDLISQSQGQLLTNFSQANTAFGVDHTAFDVVTNQGKHKKSTYVEQAADPATAANEMAIYSKDVSGSTRLFYREESAGTVVQATSAFSQVTSAASGSSFLPGGIIIKWGIFSTGTLQATGSQGFVSAFPTACYSLTLTPISKAGGTSNNGTLAPITGTVAPGGFDWSFSTGPTSSYLGFYYIAIGN